MASLMVLYKTPIDASHFDEYYMTSHLPIAKKIPGLRKYEISEGPIMTPAGPAPVYLIATLHFDDLAAIEAAFASPEGQAAGGDLVNFASGGADLLIFDSKEV